MKYPVVVLG